MIFVFGSNLAGIHGKGAALRAKEKFGAKKGQGHGLCGNSYAIPTKEHPYKTLSLREIEINVRGFLFHAQAMPDQMFFVTDIGCGLAEYKPEQIAPMFVGASYNVIVSTRFAKIMREHGDNPKLRLMYYGEL